MALTNGDYLELADKIVSTLLADTEAGGLREGDDPPVKTIEARLPEESRYYGKHELPLVAVQVIGKREVHEPSMRCVAKVFEVEFRILTRGGDRQKEDQNCKKIAHRLEKVFRQQSQSSQPFQGLPDLIENAEGVLLTGIKNTLFEAASSDEASPKRPTARAIMRGEIWVPCNFGPE
jgi:hypothetical protein